MLDLEFLASDASGFIPMYFRHMQGAIGKSNASDTLAFAPATAPIGSPQPSDFREGLTPLRMSRSAKFRRQFRIASLGLTNRLGCRLDSQQETQRDGVGSALG
jgi:hypothetical protein